MFNILLVDDEKEILELNKEMLERRGGYSVSLALNLAEAKRIIEESEPDIILLDVMLPDGTGLDFYVKLKQTKDIPVLFLTGRTGQQDKNEGLGLGADDYITKPYDNDELLMRIEAVLRRTNRVPKKLTKGSLEIIMYSNSVEFNGVDLGIKKREFDILFFLWENEDRVISAEEIYEKIWKKKLLGDSRTIRASISILQNSLKGTGYMVENIYGKGWCFGKEN